MTAQLCALLYRPLCSRLRWLCHSASRYATDIRLCEMREHNDNTLVKSFESNAKGENNTKTFGPMTFSMDRSGRPILLTDNNNTDRQPSCSPLNSLQCMRVMTACLIRERLDGGDIPQKMVVNQPNQTCCFHSQLETFRNVLPDSSA